MARDGEARLPSGMKMKVPQFASVLQVQPRAFRELGRRGTLNAYGRPSDSRVRLCGGDVAKVRVNSQSKLVTKGRMGGRRTASDECVAKGDTCWQFKSGKDGEPANLKGEVVKEVPAATLKAGGWFVVVAWPALTARRVRTRAWRA